MKNTRKKLSEDGILDTISEGIADGLYKENIGYRIGRITGRILFYSWIFYGGYILGNRGF